MRRTPYVGCEGRDSPLVKEAQREGEAVLQAAGIPVATAEEDRTRRGDHLKLRNTTSGAVERRIELAEPGPPTGSIEVEFLNGEIVLLGALHGVATPVNALLQRVGARSRPRGSPAGQRGESPKLSEAAGVPAP